MDNFIEKICQHKDCGRHFENLHKLILHIESTHIDFSCMDDDKTKEYLDSDDDGEFPTRGIPMSLVLPYSNEEQIAAFREEEELQAKYAEDSGENGFGDNSSEIIDVLATDDAGDAHARHSSSKAYWYGPEASPENAPPKADAHHTHPVMKKFACPVPGCTKSYKNVNGMKYHVVNYHDMHGNLMKPVKQKKEFKCTYCGKDYKTFRGLQSHIQGHQQQQQLQQQPQLQDPRGIPSTLMQQHRGRPFYQKVDYYRQSAQQAQGHAHAYAQASRDFRYGQASAPGESSGADADDVVCFGEYTLPKAPAASASGRAVSSGDAAAAPRRNLYGSAAAGSSAGRQRLAMQANQGASNVLHKKAGDNAALPVFAPGAYGARCGGADDGNGYGFEDDYGDANMHYQQLHKQYFQQQQMFGAAGQRVARRGVGGANVGGDYVEARTTESFEFVRAGHHRQDEDDE